MIDKSNQTPFKALLLAALVLLHGCASVVHEKDAAPLGRLDPGTLSDAVPRHDIITRAGNKNPYTVLGKTYHLLPTSKGYREAGVASWYGTKFHGKPTANGEPYSLYGMSAAHKTLPIPAYVRVTNLANNRQAIVRVNDRGPFHDNRVIDLSYAAAVKLGFADQGTAPVLVEAIDPSDYSAPAAQAVLAPAPAKIFVQVGAFRSPQSAQLLQAQLTPLFSTPVNVTASEGATVFHRVRVGPIATPTEAQAISDRILALNLGTPRLVSE